MFLDARSTWIDALWLGIPEEMEIKTEKQKIAVTKWNCVTLLYYRTRFCKA